MAANNDDATKQIFSRCLLYCLQIPLWYIICLILFMAFGEVLFLLSLLDDFQLGVGIKRFLGRVQATKLLLLYSCISVRSTNISKLIFRLVSCKVLLVCVLEGTCLARVSLKYWTFYL